MNRKKAIQSLLAFAAVGVSSVSIYEWTSSGHAVKLNELPQKKQLLAELAETIIPRTDTPGAKDAHVEEFIIKMIQESDQKSQHNFLAGLGSLEKYIADKYGRSFIQCTPQQKFAILKHFEDKANYPIAILNKINNKFLGTPFFNKLKELTVEGYCTSQLGATQGMAYNYIPVKFEGRLPLQKNQKAWATK
jgi:dihydropteroate synthase